MNAFYVLLYVVMIFLTYIGFRLTELKYATEEEKAGLVLASFVWPVILAIYSGLILAEFVEKTVYGTVHGLEWCLNKLKGKKNVKTKNALHRLSPLRNKKRENRHP